MEPAIPLQDAPEHFRTFITEHAEHLRQLGFVVDEVTVEPMNDWFTKVWIRPEWALHFFDRPDTGEMAHDHPAAFTSLVMQGGYIEWQYKFLPPDPQFPLPMQNWGVTEIIRKVGDAFYVPADHIHKIVSLPNGPCVTLVKMHSRTNENNRFYRFTEHGISSRAWHETEWMPHQLQNA